LAPGSYRGTITFTSDAVPAASQAVEVQLTIPGATPTCNGDCNGDGRVRSNEVTVMINIINGKAELTSCPAADANGDGRVRSNEVTIAINNINRGCPAAAGN
jgi:hypothetical protein